MWISPEPCEERFSWHGGARLDTVFIDEGFGNLDGDALDRAMTALSGLQDAGKPVAVIPHVPEVKERIPDRLEVRKTRTGSKASLQLN